MTPKCYPFYTKFWHIEGRVRRNPPGYIRGRSAIAATGRRGYGLEEHRSAPARSCVTGAMRGDDAGSTGALEACDLPVLDGDAYGETVVLPSAGDIPNEPLGVRLRHGDFFKSLVIRAEEDDLHCFCLPPTGRRAVLGAGVGLAGSARMWGATLRGGGTPALPGLSVGDHALRFLAKRLGTAWRLVGQYPEVIGDPPNLLVSMFHPTRIEQTQKSPVKNG